MTNGTPNSALHLIALALALLATLACSRATALLNPKTAAESLADGAAAAAAGDYDQARADFTAALTADPQLAAAFAARGDLHYLLGEYDLAVADYAQALELGYEPAAQVLIARAEAYFAAGDFALGGADYGEAHSPGPEFVRDYYTDRLATLSQAIEQHPELASAYFARARVESVMQASEQALADYNRAIELNQAPQSAAYFWRAWANAAVGDGQSAVFDFTQAIELDPNMVQAYDGRGHIYILLSQYESGLDDLLTAVQIDPNYAEGHNNLCWFGSLLGYATEVMDSCERAVALAPDSPAYADSRGLARALTGDYAGAIEDFQFYLDFLTARGLDDKDRALWIEMLQTGLNPFDAETLQRLLEN